MNTKKISNDPNIFLPVHPANLKIAGVHKKLQALEVLQTEKGRVVMGWPPKNTSERKKLPQRKEPPLEIVNVVNSIDPSSNTTQSGDMHSPDPIQRKSS